LNSENSQLYGSDQTPTNNTDNSDVNDGDDNGDVNNGDGHSDNNDNNLLSTLSFIPHRSIDNLSPNTVSSRSGNSSLLSGILNTNNSIEPQNNNFVDQTTEPINHLRNEFLPSVDDIMNQLTNMLDYDPLNIEQSSKSTL
jgi:hypothetical protein